MRYNNWKVYFDEKFKIKMEKKEPSNKIIQNNNFNGYY